MIKIQDKKVEDLPLSQDCLDKAKLPYIRPFKKNTDLSDIDFRKINLKEAPEYLNLKNFSKSDLRGADFRNVQLQKANLREANLQDADLRGTDLNDAILDLANLTDIRIDKNPKMDLKWEVVAKILDSEPKLDGQQLDQELKRLRQEKGELDLRFAYLANSDLSRLDKDQLKELLEDGERPDRFTDLKDAKLEGANLRGANLTGVDLTRAHLEEALIQEDNPPYQEKVATNLNRAILEGATLVKANLKGADLTWANLKAAKLQKANLTNTDLRKAHLTWACLNGADLTNADLRGANLSNAVLTGAKGAILPEDSELLKDTTMPNQPIPENSECLKSEQE
jgi:uncharacterized protein YjbI with pentapeptide repeats